jgi:SMODS and SLOG-associating 2TM effector domain family 5
MIKGQANMSDRSQNPVQAPVGNPVQARVDGLPADHAEYLHEIKRKAWITKSSRFAASRRFERLSLTSMIVVSFIAIFNILISVTLIVLSDNLTDMLIKIASVASVTISVYLIFLDLFLAFRTYDKRAFVMATSARRINALVDEINLLASKGIDQTTLDNISTRYRQILDDFEGDHGDIDFQYATIEYHPGNSWFKKFKDSASFKFYHIGVFLLALFFPTLVLIISGISFYEINSGRFSGFVP